MIDFKTAVLKAKQHYADAFSVPVGEIRLEEIEKDDYKGQKVWSVTVSGPKPLNQKVPVENLANLFRDIRDYRVVIVNAESGEPLALRIREFAGA
jgi:hypothetical protein